tara:strand:+ start:548 stop:832 length:285 start_codon:yes stop_codon:yes gene_type:complete
MPKVKRKVTRAHVYLAVWRGVAVFRQKMLVRLDNFTKKPVLTKKDQERAFLLYCKAHPDFCLRLLREYRRYVVASQREKNQPIIANAAKTGSEK